MTFVKLLQSPGYSKPTHRQTPVSDLNDAHERAWSSMLATQAMNGYRLVQRLQIEYDQACARQLGPVNEVALLRGHLQLLVAVDR